MTDEEIVANLHKMVARFGEMLNNPVLQGTLPLIRISMKPDEDGRRMRLTVGADFADDDE